MPTRSFSEKEADRINRAIVPVRLVELVAYPTDDQTRPHRALLVRIDADQRPNLRDAMGRVQHPWHPGPSEIPAIYDTILGQEALIQYISLSDSVDGDITIILSWREHEAALRYLADSPLLLICTSDEQDIVGHSIGITITGDDLHQAIATWERRISLHDTYSITGA